MHDEFLVDESWKLGLDHDMLSKFISVDGTVNIRGAVPIRVDDPLVLACFEGTEYRPHYRAMRFVHTTLEDVRIGDGGLHSLANAYRNRPLVMKPIPQQEVFEYTGLCVESTITTTSESGTFCTPITVNPRYTSTGFIPGTYRTNGPGCEATVWSKERDYMGYVYAMLPPTFRSAYDIEEETKFTWFAGQHTLSVPMGELHEILEPWLEGNSGLVCMVLSFLPCDAEVLEILIVDVSHKPLDRTSGKRKCLWSWPNQFDQIQCLKDDDINGNKWVRCPLVSFLTQFV
jgi:hypothetical protein